MNEKRVTLGKAPQVTITCRGDLEIRGWAKLDISVRGDKFEIVEGEKGLSIDGTGDLKIYVPSAASITVAANAGDLRVKNLDGDLVVSEVEGDLGLRNLGKVTVDSVLGDLSGRKLSGSFFARQIKGDLNLKNLQGFEVEKISGDCIVANVNGDAILKLVIGDLSLKSVKGDVNVELCQGSLDLRFLGGVNSVTEVRGDLRLRGGLAPGKHNFSAGGDIAIRWPSGAPLHLEANADQIRSRIELVDVVEEAGFLSGRHGQGDTFLILTSKGRIILKEIEAGRAWGPYQDSDVDYEVDLNGLGDYIASEINNRLNEWSTHVEQEFGPAFVTQIERTAYDAAAKAEKAAEKAVRRAEKAAKKAYWHTSRSTWSGRTEPPPRSKNKEKKASEEEQLKILRMVEQGTITPDEATTLLEALGN